MSRYAILLLLVLGARGFAQTVTFDGSSFPEEQGDWIRREFPYPADRWIDDGWFVQYVEIVDQGPPVIGERDSYEHSLAALTGSDTYIEWVMVTDGPKVTTAWVKAIESLLWDGNVREILTRLEMERAQARSPTRRKALHELITYLGNQDDRLAYDKFRARDLDIGSGPVEAACKHVVGARMKRSGMRWSRRGSQATLSLRVAWLNGEWDELWAQRPLAA